MKICITGGSGFVGTRLSYELVSLGHSVINIDVFPPKQEIENVYFIPADLTSGVVPPEVLECDAIVHLAGVNIFGRWTPEYKKRIFDSRILSANAVISACARSQKHPAVFVSASAIGYYGDSGERELTEDARLGTDFLSDVCMKWEDVASSAETIGMRRVSIRTGIVLGPGGGMLAKLIPIFKWGIGGRLGSGKQWFSWIHIDDLIAVYIQAITNTALSGAVNAVAPEPVRNRDFTQALADILNRPAFFMVPGFVLRMVLGELAGAILGSQKVIPAKLQKAGFVWKYPTIESALMNVFKKS